MDKHQLESLRTTVQKQSADLVHAQIVNRDLEACGDLINALSTVGAPPEHLHLLHVIQKDAQNVFFTDCYELVQEHKARIWEAMKEAMELEIKHIQGELAAEFKEL